ncbi:hypothetical protein AB4Y45_02155 [Paraburkholderia sp. EG287A]|uniref:hypothetical protein n=1 Tax=unclassified Paraburkholderia TaxID=2615204 RepID=UPI0034D207A4
MSAGTITVTDEANQTQDVANLSRDTTSTNGTVSRLPDVSALLNQQGDRMSAAQAAGQAVAQRIGDYADAQARATGDPAWAEGGNKRAEMQAAGAAVVAGLGGGVGSAVAGAAGAGIGSKMGGELNKLSDSIAASNLTGDANMNAALGNIVANVIATGAGAAVGGAGAFGSSTVDLYNRQLHPDERQWAKDNAGKFAQFYEGQTGQTITTDQAQQMLLANGYRLVDDMASKGPGGDPLAVQFISQNASGLFNATPAERANPGRLGGPLTPEQPALPGYEAHPQVGMAVGAAVGITTLGAVAPIAATAWGLGALYDYSGDALSRALGLSNDDPNVGKSLMVGGITAAISALSLPLGALGKEAGIAGKVVVGGYNAAVAGVGSFGATAVADSGSPDLAAGVGIGSNALGALMTGMMPGPLGNFLK